MEILPQQHLEGCTPILLDKMANRDYLRSLHPKGGLAIPVSPE
ncbi:MAG: hypothetical protein AAF399_18695 [Bacteroidota bacterium]